MAKFNLELTEDQISYYENLDCENLIDDMEMIININNGFDFENLDFEFDTNKNALI